MSLAWIWTQGPQAKYVHGTMHYPKGTVHGFYGEVIAATRDEALTLAREAFAKERAYHEQWIANGRPEKRPDVSRAPVRIMLRAFTDWGGYTMQYCDRHGDDLCARCASKPAIWAEHGPIRGGVYYEGPTLECAECGAQIESAYGDPDANEENEENDATANS